MIPIQTFGLRLTAVIFTVLLFNLHSVCSFAQSDSLPTTNASQTNYSLTEQLTNKFTPMVEQSISEGSTSGVVVAIGRHSPSGPGLIYLKAWGNRQNEVINGQMFTESMPTDAIFDLASISKVASTTLCVHILADRGLINLKERVSFYMPEFQGKGKDPITIWDCLTHTSGLTPDNSLRDYMGTEEQSWLNICNLPLVWEIGQRFAYSDVNFIVLGKLVERVSGKKLDEFASENIFKPLGMADTGYHRLSEPISEALIHRTVPTEKRIPGDAACLRGYVHDPRAYALDGVAGHAGLFSTAEDMAILSQMLLNSGSYIKSDNNEVRLFRKESFDRMTADVSLPGGITRALGWSKSVLYFSDDHRRMSDSAFGHSGFTGTSFWIDQQNDLYVILLSSRLHPDGRGGVNGLAEKIVEAAVDTICITNQKSTSSK